MGYGLKNPDEKGVIPGWEWWTAQQVLDRVLKQANENPEFGYGAWLNALHRDGLTRELASYINQLMGSLTCHAVAELDECGKLAWTIKLEEFDGLAVSLFRDAHEEAEIVKEQGPPFRVLRENPELADGSHKHTAELQRFILAYYAYGFAYLLNDGVLDNLRICERPECKKFYIGGPRSRWCSENCGSIVRVKRKRKRDKVQGAML